MTPALTIFYLGLVAVIAVAIVRLQEKRAKRIQLQKRFNEEADRFNEAARAGDLERMGTHREACKEIHSEMVKEAA